MMFRVIGGAVVYGFALYGAAKFLDRQKPEVVIKPASSKQAGSSQDGAQADQAAGPDGKRTGDVVGET